MESEIATAEDSRSSSVCSVVRMSPKAVGTPPIVMTPVFPQTNQTPLSLLYRNSSPSVLKKIMSKNQNKTVYLTSYPSNLAELQLFRVMQNASLLYYYDTLLEMGGDDVHQLCDAGEEEFLEIMSLVGMASKPLHVRRLQKSLHEWMSNPNKFKTPLIPGEDFDVEISSPRISSNYGFQGALDPGIPETKIPYPVPVSGEPPTLPSPATSSAHILSKRPYSPLDGPSCPPSSSSSPGAISSVNATPSLSELQIAKIAAAAEKISKQLPHVEPKPFNNKKKMCKDLELVMSMLEDDPRRMDEIRRYAAIYGRFDCKRKPEKQLTLHEVSVNEAAAQICRFFPSLLTRRDELFPLARQIVKESGFNYSKTHVSSSISNKYYNEMSESQNSINSLEGKLGSKILDSDHPSKRAKLDIDGKSDLSNSSYSNTESAGGFDGSSFTKTENQENCLTQSPFRLFFQQNSKNLSIKDNIPRNISTIETEDSIEDSYLSSNCNSPVQTSDQDNENTSSMKFIQEDYNSPETRNEKNKMSPSLQVIAASGDNIIAVANPALAMSASILPRKLENLT